MTIDELLKTTSLRGLTLWPAEGGWQASATMDGVGWRIGIDPDPLEALKAALRQCTDFMS